MLLLGVQVKPGKPLLIGEAFGKPIVGVPGYPFGAFTWMDVLVPVIVSNLMGQDSPERVELAAAFVVDYERNRKVREVLRVRLSEHELRQGSFFVLPSTSSRMRPTLEGDGKLVLEAEKTKALRGERGQV